jgi:Tfp pilus assembly protein PilO
MKTNMTERDKKLLVGMFIGVIIVAVGYWGIRPQLKQYFALAEKIEKEEDTQKLNKQKLLNVGSIAAQADSYEEKIAERKDEFYPVMSSSEVDRMMTQMAVGHNLNVYDLSFNMPTSPTGRLAYQNSSLYAWQLEAMANYSEEGESSASDKVDSLLDEEDSDEDSGETNDKSSAPGKSEEDIMSDVMGGEEGGYQPNTDIYAVPVTITVGGDVYDLEQFIAEINNLDKRALLLGYSWGEFREVVRRDADGNIISSESSTSSEGVSTDELSDANLEVVTRKSLTVRLEIYMCDTSDVATATDAETTEE